MSEKILDAVIVEPSAPAKAAVIWLHGLGADGHDFEPVVPQLGMPASTPTRFVFPHAPQRAVTVNMGYVMRAWYDIVSLDKADEDEPGVLASEGLVRALIQREIDAGIPSERIVVAGFSQGGAMALRTGLCYPHRLAGVMGLSCYLPISRRFKADAHPANQATEVFIAHGTVDPVVPFELGKDSYDYLQGLGYYASLHTYAVGHGVSPKEISDIGAWLRKVLS